MRSRNKSAPLYNLKLSSHEHLVILFRTLRYHRLNNGLTVFDRCVIFLGFRTKKSPHRGDKTRRAFLFVISERFLPETLGTDFTLPGKFRSLDPEKTFF